MLRSLRCSFSLRLGNGSGGLVFDHDGRAYQSVWCPSWWSASGPPSESCLAVVAEIGSGDGSSECGAEPGARLLVESLSEQGGGERAGPVGGSFAVVICDVIITVYVRQSKCLPMDYSNEVLRIDYSNERATIP